MSILPVGESYSLRKYSPVQLSLSVGAINYLCLFFLFIFILIFMNHYFIYHEK